MRPSRTVFGAALSALVSAAFLAACSGDGTSPCDPATTKALAVGVLVTDALDTGHCISGGDPGDIFTMTLSQQSVIRFTATSAAFQPEIAIAKPGSPPSPDDEVVFAAGKKAVAVLPAGQYVVDIQSSDNAVGAYTLNTEVVGLNACHDTPGTLVFMAAGQTLNSEITTADCAPAAAPTARYELYGVYLRAGRPYTITATTAINSFNLSLGTSSTNPTIVAGGVVTTSGNATMTYTPTSSGYFVIGFAPLGTRTGAYTLTISP